MLTQKRLHDILHYDPQTGIFRWRTGKRKGQVAGTRHDVSCCRFRGHRDKVFNGTGEWEC